MKFEVPQRQQLASERTSLTLFAPAPSTTPFVPLTRNLSLADPSPYPGVDRPLRGNCHPLQSIHRLLNVPPVATVKLVNAYQFEKFGTGNGLLWYATHLQRCAKQPPAPPNAFSKAQKRHPATLNASSKACRAKSSTCPPDAASVRERAPALSVRSGGPFPCPFDGTRYRKQPTARR